MKKLLTLTILTLTTTTWGSARDIYDVMYLPVAGTAYGISELSYTKINIHEDGNKTDVDGPLFSQTLGYSFQDNFSLDANLSYVKAEVDPSNAKTTDYEGLSDLNLGARYRFLENEYVLDLLASATISRGDHEIKSNGDSDNLIGGHVLSLGAQFGKKTENLQWAISANVYRFLESTTDNKVFDEKLDGDAHFGYKFRADILNKMSEKSWFRTHLSAEFVDSYEIEKSSVASVTNFEIGGEYQHLVSQDFLIRLGIAHDQYVTDSIQQYNAFTFLAGANYQF